MSSGSIWGSIEVTDCSRASVSATVAAAAVIVVEAAVFCFVFAVERSETLGRRLLWLSMTVAFLMKPRAGLAAQRQCTYHPPIPINGNSPH